MRGRRNGTVLFALVACSVIIALLTGCQGKGGKAAATISAAEVGERIGQAVSLLENMKQGDATKLKKLYGIDAGEIESFVLYTASSNVKADELVVIQVKNASQTEEVQARIVQRIEAQTKKMKDYRPDEYYLINKHVLKINGPYVLFAVSKDAAKMGQAFDEALK